MSVEVYSHKQFMNAMRGNVNRMKTRMAKKRAGISREFLRNMKYLYEIETYITTGGKDNRLGLKYKQDVTHKINRDLGLAEVPLLRGEVVDLPLELKAGPTFKSNSKKKANEGIVLDLFYTYKDKPGSKFSIEQFAKKHTGGFSITSVEKERLKERYKEQGLEGKFPNQFPDAPPRPFLAAILKHRSMQKYMKDLSIDAMRDSFVGFKTAVVNKK